MRRVPEFANVRSDSRSVRPREGPFPPPDAACLVGLLNWRNPRVPGEAERRAIGSGGRLAAAATPRPHRDTVDLAQSGRAHRSVPALRGIRRRRCPPFRTHVLPSPPRPSLAQSRPRHRRIWLSREKRWHWQRPEMELWQENPVTRGRYNRKETPSTERPEPVPTSKLGARLGMG